MLKNRTACDKLPEVCNVQCICFQSVENADEALQVLKMVQQLTERANQEESSFACMNALQDQLAKAEEIDIPTDRLLEAYDALERLRDNVDMVRTHSR